jgi:hypothetical protein
MKEALKLGVARRVITPKIGCNLSGYAPDVYSESLNDDLTATAYCFSQGDTTALIVSVTVVSIRTSLANEILDLIEACTGIPRDRCILHAIHNHSGPITNGGFGWGDIDREYCDTILIPRILEAVKEATEGLKPVKMKISVGESYVGVNRREITEENKVILGQNPWGSFDPKMTVISFCDESAAPVANLVHYGCHGTASGKNHEISRDWAGVMIDMLEENSGAMTAYLNGPEGDVGPRLANGRTVGKQHVRYALELGGVAGGDAVRIYKQAGGYCDAELQVSTSTLSIPLGKRVPKEVAEAEYETFKGYTVNLKARKGLFYKRVLDSYLEDYQEIDAIEVKQTVIRIGDIAIVSFPYELFSEIGMRIAKSSPFPYTLTLSNTNGSEGYFVTEDQICRGGYEVDMFLTKHVQPYLPNVDHFAVTQTLAHLRRMKGE